MDAPPVSVKAADVAVQAEALGGGAKDVSPPSPANEEGQSLPAPVPLPAPVHDEQPRDAPEPRADPGDKAMCETAEPAVPSNGTAQEAAPPSSALAAAPEGGGGGDDASAALSAATGELAALGYAFNEADELRSAPGGTPFSFVNQAHYEKLADAVARFVAALLRVRHSLVTATVGGVPVLLSHDWWSSKAGCVLLCGAGAVAAGQWARRLCINESLHTGSVGPYVRWAASSGLGVCILNPNHASARSEAHTAAAWRDLVAANAAMEHVVMVAHSYGGATRDGMPHNSSYRPVSRNVFVCFCSRACMPGVCTVSLLRDVPSCLSKLRGVALTDSVHGRGVERAPPPARRFFSKHCVNWVTSSLPRDARVRPAVNEPGSGDGDARDTSSSDDDDDGGDAAQPAAAAAAAAPRRRQKSGATASARSWWASPRCDAERLSAGTPVHESTSEACRPSATAFLAQRLLRAGWQPTGHPPAGAQPAGGVGVSAA